MYTQLTLTEPESDEPVAVYDWTINAETRNIGRNGLRMARARLAAAAARADATTDVDRPLAA